MADGTDSHRAFWVGFHTASGVTVYIAMFGTIAFLISMAFDHLGWGDHNNSDPQPGVHSGLTVRTDALTGCQYLEAGSLTPRLGADGHQLCGRHQ